MRCQDDTGADVTLTVYYYIEQADLDAADGDLDALDWQAEGYEVG